MILVKNGFGFNRLRCSICGKFVSPKDIWKSVSVVGLPYLEEFEHLSCQLRRDSLFKGAKEVK